MKMFYECINDLISTVVSKLAFLYIWMNEYHLASVLYALYAIDFISSFFAAIALSTVYAYISYNHNR